MKIKQENFWTGFKEMVIACAVLSAVALFVVCFGPGRPPAVQISLAVMGMVSDAYAQYQDAHTPDEKTTPADLIPYINYVAVDTTTSFDGTPSLPVASSCANNYCLRLRSGKAASALVFVDTQPFGATKPHSRIHFYLLPVDAAHYPGVIDIVQYFNGKTTTGGCLKQGSDPDWWAKYMGNC